tara:strand:- start:56 stop:463 length:408 start_codon:yes stop_codon:yes gene_type:complete
MSAISSSGVYCADAGQTSCIIPEARVQAPVRVDTGARGLVRFHCPARAFSQPRRSGTTALVEEAMQLIEQGRGVREGYCATTTADVIGDCDQGDQGSINLMSPQMAARRCLQLCFECTRCKHISFTALQQGGEYN